MCACLGVLQLCQGATSRGVPSSSVLQCVAVCCSVLQRVAVCCSVLQCVAGCCSVLQCVAVCCSVLQCVAVHTPLHAIVYLCAEVFVQDFFLK